MRASCDDASSLTPKKKGGVPPPSRLLLVVNSIIRQATTGSAYSWLFVFLPALCYHLHRSFLSGVAEESVFLKRYRPIASAVQVFASAGGDGLERNGMETEDAHDVGARNYDRLGDLLYLSTEGANYGWLAERSRTLHRQQRKESGPDDDGAAGIDMMMFVDVPLSDGANLEVVLDGFESLAGLRWVHDDDLGRGYLLFSDTGANRIWRWEVGGGPITIGRTLHMERSGCRSNRTRCSQLAAPGSAGLAVEMSGGADSSDGNKLVVCERGERRIVRIEEDGARTPLATHAGNVRGDDGGGEAPRLHSPTSLVYGPLGDLFFTDPGAAGDLAAMGGGAGSDDAGEPASLADDDGHRDDSFLAGIWRVNEAVHADPITAKLSRAAHFAPANTSIDLLYGNAKIPYGIDMCPDLSSIYVTDADPENMVILKIPIEEEEDDISLDDEGEESDDEDAESAEKPTERRNESSVEDEEGLGGDPIEDGRTQSSCSSDGTDSVCSSPVGLFDDATDILFFNATFLATGGHDGVMAGLRTDEKGNVWSTGPGGVLVVSDAGELIGRIPIDEEFATDVTFGGDGYFYVTTKTKLLRIRAKVKGANVPNLVTNRKRTT